MFIPFRAKARPSKKAKLNKPPDDNTTTEPEKTPEPEDTNADTILNDPPPQDHDLTTEQMEVDPEEGRVDKPASLVWATDKPPSPHKAGDDNMDDIMITGVGHSTPGNPVALSKHSAKEEFAAMDKGKWTTDLSSYAHLNAQDIHSGFLNRLYTSRDYEAGLVGPMKGRYEVNITHSA